MLDGVRLLLAEMVKLAHGTVQVAPLKLLHDSRLSRWLAEIFGIFCLCWMGRGVLWGIFHSWRWESYQDSPIFNYVGRRILEGAVPYKDIFEMNFPGTYLLYAFWQAIFGRSDLAFRLFDLTWCALAVVAIVVFCRARSWVFALAAGGYFVCVHFSHGAYAMGQRDFLMVPFLLFAACALMYFLDLFSNFRWIFVVGVLVACAFWIKPQAGLFLAMTTYVLMFYPVEFRQRVRAILWLGAGFGVPFSVVHAWLYCIGGLADFYDIFFHFTLPIYSKLSAYDRFDSWAFKMAALRFVIVMGVVFFASGSTRASKTTLLMCFVYGEIHYYGQKNFYYQKYPLHAFSALGVAWILPCLRMRLWKQCVFYALVVNQIIHYTPSENLSVGRVAWFQSGVHIYGAGYEAQVVRDADEALRAVPDAIREPYLAAHALQSIQVFDHVSGGLWSVAYHEGWVMPTRHIYSYPFYNLAGSSYMFSLGRELQGQLQESKPLVIMVGGDSYPLPFGAVWRMIDTNSGFHPFFAKYYQLVVTNRYYRVYARKL